MHVEYACGLLLQMSHVAWSVCVCVSVCLSVCLCAGHTGQLCKKTAEAKRSRCSSGTDSCQPKELYIRC